MPRVLKKSFKYKCQELLCNTVHRHDKWLEHCKKKHVYKFQNNLNIKYKVIEVKEGSGPWKPYTESAAEVQGQVESDQRADPDLNSDSEMTLQPPQPSCSFSEFTPSTSHTTPAAQEVATYSAAEHQYESHQDLVIKDREAAITIPDTSDPAIYVGKRLLEQDINSALLLENQVLDNDYDFPVVNNRKFCPSWKKCKLPDGTIRERTWLVYSKQNDAAYCLHCLLFSLPGQTTIWSTTGYRGWQSGHVTRDIDIHEGSKNHLACQVGKLQWISKRHVNKQMLDQKNRGIEHNREVLSVVIDCCRYLSEEMMAFRKNKFLEGKLPNLFKTLSKYSPDARIYYEKIQNCRKENKTVNPNFLSYRNISDLIDIMAKLVRKNIVQNIERNSNKFSLIVDSTQDVSKKEATAILLRYVEDTERGEKPVERLFKVFTCGDTSGANMKDNIFTCLKEDGITPKNIIGQSMDGAGNMRGACKGLSSLIKKENKKAFYVWCSSHRFALVIDKSISICPEMRNLFSLLEEIYVFMSGYKKQSQFVTNLLLSKKGKIRLKRVQTTRWSSRNEAVKTILKCYNELIVTLDGLSKHEKGDSETVATAKGLMKKLKDYEVIVSLHVAESIFSILNQVTITLQGIVVDYGIVQEVIQGVKSKVLSLRCDRKWEDLLSKIDEFCHKNDVLQEDGLPKLRGVKRKKTKFMDELGVDEPILDVKRRLKVEVYFKVIDSLHGQLQDRFSDHSLQIVKQMSHFTHENILKMKMSDTKCSSEQILELCTFYGIDPELASEEVNEFSDVYHQVHAHIGIDDLLPEINSNNKKANDEKEVSNPDEETYDPLEDMKDVEGKDEKKVQSWVNHGFIKPYRCISQFSSFPNLNVLYKILLSLPVTSCSAERAMSRLKIVKNRLRSSMTDNLLSNLMVLSCEKDILRTITNSDIVDNFSKTTTTRKRLLSLA